MAYRLRNGESVEQGIRRIVSEQIERALAELADARMDRADLIHQVRKRCKRIRAALRLVRDGLGDAYGRENARYRDAARSISAARDVEAMIETCDALAERYTGQEEERVVLPVRQQLHERRQAFMADSERIDDMLRDFESAMKAGHERVASLSIKGNGHAVVLAGMRRTYARARSAMHAAYADTQPEVFHAWRKSVAYHAYHMHLLRHAWPVMMRARQGEADRLGEALGDEHSLQVLRAWVLKNSASLGQEPDVGAFIRLVEHRVVQIRRHGKRWGRWLFAENPQQLARRIGVYLEIGSTQD